MDTIKFTKEMAEKLQKEYAKAVQNKNETFIFEGKKLLTDYAKYMLEYLRMRGL